jgi:L-fucose isomerase-like protein
MVTPRIGSYAVYEPDEEGWENWEDQFEHVNAALREAGLDVVAAPEAVKDLASMERVAAFFADQDIDLLHALIITWSFDHYTIEILQWVALPIVIRAIPGIRTGSLVGAQQLNSVLFDLEITCKLVYGTIPSAEAAEEAATYAKACAIRRKLRGARMAVVGRRTEGMTPTAVDEIEILRLFGTRLLNYGLDEILEQAAQVEPAAAATAWERFAAGASAVMSRTEHGINSARNYIVFKDMVEHLELDAISIGSYPRCQGTMCIPISWLNEEGIPIGCEGDVNSSLNMLILSMLSDDPVHFGEMLAIDEAENTIVTSHCGCGSPSLADENSFILHPVRLANDGVCIRYTAKPGPVTFVNLVGRKGNYRMCAFQGEAVRTDMVFEGNPLKFVMQTPFRTIWRDVAEHGFGHHWMTVYAHVVPVLDEFCRLIGIKGVFPDLNRQ